MDYQVVLSPSARADLRDIVRYISLDAPDRALRFGQFLVSHTKRLAQFPELGRVVYRLNHSARLVEVIRFWHAGRGTPEMDAEISI